jgi:hypothetical protein
LQDGGLCVNSCSGQGGFACDNEKHLHWFLTLMKEVVALFKWISLALRQ